MASMVLRVQISCYFIQNVALQMPSPMNYLQNMYYQQPMQYYSDQMVQAPMQHFNYNPAPNRRSGKSTYKKKRRYKRRRHSRSYESRSSSHESQSEECKCSCDRCAQPTECCVQECNACPNLNPGIVFIPYPYPMIITQQSKSKKTDNTDKTAAEKLEKNDTKTVGDGDSDKKQPQEQQQNPPEKTETDENNKKLLRNRLKSKISVIEEFISVENKDETQNKLPKSKSRVRVKEHFISEKDKNEILSQFLNSNSRTTEKEEFVAVEDKDMKDKKKLAKLNPKIVKEEFDPESEQTTTTETTTTEPTTTTTTLTTNTTTTITNTTPKTETLITKFEFTTQSLQNLFTLLPQYRPKMDFSNLYDYPYRNYTEEIDDLYHQLGRRKEQRYNDIIFKTPKNIGETKYVMTSLRKVKDDWLPKYGIVPIPDNMAAELMLNVKGMNERRSIQEHREIEDIKNIQSKAEFRRHKDIKFKHPYSKHLYQKRRALMI